MKKKLVLALFSSVIFAASMVCSVSAAENTEGWTEVKPGSPTGTTVECTVTGDEVKSFHVNATAESPNQECLLLVLRLEGGNTAELAQNPGTITEENYSVSEDTILYIDQAASDADGNVDFDGFLPMFIEDSVVLLCGGESPVVLGSIIGHSTGVTVSGSVESFRTDAEVTVELIDSNNNVVDTKTVKSTESKKNIYASVFAFDGITSGTYDLRVSKTGHVTRTYTLTVEDVNLDCTAVICIPGDVTGDGKINAIDYAWVKKTAQKKLDLNDYQIAVADVDNNKKVNALDFAKVRKMAQGKIPY